MTELKSTENPSTFGQAIALIALVSPEDGEGPTPTGFVSFREGDIDLGIVALEDGMGIFSTATLSAGTHFLSAVYGGDETYLASESPLLVQFVVQAITQTVLETSGSPTVVGEEVTFLATVLSVAPGGGIPSGTVYFLNGGEPIGEAELDDNGQTWVTTIFSAAGTYPITAFYPGNDDYFGSTSPGLNQVVARAATSTDLEVGADQAVFGELVLLTARVAAVKPGEGTPTGTVTFRAGPVVLGTVGLDEDGFAELFADNILAGTQSLTAVYNGDPDYQGSTSAPVGILISRADTETIVDAAPNPARIGERITFTITVTALEPSMGIPTGLVVLLNGTQPIGSAQLQDGVAVITLNTLPVGRYSITARYDGSPNFQLSISGELPVFVGTDNERWVAQVYRDLLLRQVDPGGLAAYSRMLDDGVSHAEVARRLMFECNGIPGRCEFYEHTVNTIYQRFLRRNADIAGLIAFAQWLRDGGTIAEVKARILGSNEYFNNGQFGGGGTNNGFVTAVFRDVYGRAPTSTERTFWLQVLQQGAGRDSVALSLLRNSESLALIATEYVQRLLRREPDQQDLDELIFLLQNNREELVIAAIVGSFEYIFNV